MRKIITHKMEITENEMCFPLKKSELNKNDIHFQP